jgi:hypothetical protein
MNYYTDEQKRIMEGFFLLSGPSVSRHEYHQFTDEFISRLKKKLDKHSQHTFNTHNWMWNGEHNLVTYMLSHPNLDTSHNRLWEMNLTRPDWRHQDAQGNTSLHLMIPRYELETVEKVATDFKIDCNIQNNQKEYFTWFYFKPALYKKLEKTKKDALYFYTSVSSNLRLAVHLLEKYPEHFSGEQNLQNIGEHFLKTKKFITETNPFLKQFERQPEVFNPLITARLEGLIASCHSYIYDIDKHMGKYMLYYNLNENLPEHYEETGSIKTPKI